MTFLADSPVRSLSLPRPSERCSIASITAPLFSFSTVVLFLLGSYCAPSVDIKGPSFPIPHFRNRLLLLYSILHQFELPNQLSNPVEMAPSKRNFDDAAAWEAVPATKRPRVIEESEQSGLLNNQGNFESLASQRPKRERKRPERYSDTLPQPSARKRTATPKTIPKRSLKQPATTVKHKVLLPGVRRKNSKIAVLKVPLDGLLSSMSPDQKQEHEEHESDLSSPPSSLPPSPVSKLGNPRN